MVIDAVDKFAKKAAAALVSPKLVAYDGRTAAQEVDYRTTLFTDEYNAMIEEVIIARMF